VASPRLGRCSPRHGASPNVAPWRVEERQPNSRSTSDELPSPGPGGRSRVSRLTTRRSCCGGALRASTLPAMPAALSPRGGGHSPFLGLRRADRRPTLALEARWRLQDSSGLRQVRLMPRTRAGIAMGTTRCRPRSPAQQRPSVDHAAPWVPPRGLLPDARRSPHAPAGVARCQKARDVGSSLIMPRRGLRPAARPSARAGSSRGRGRPS